MIRVQSLISVRKKQAIKYVLKRRIMEIYGFIYSFSFYFIYTNISEKLLASLYVGV